MHPLRLIGCCAVLIAFASAAVASGEADALRYTVTDQVSLRDISILLYGKARYWRQIARLNHLKKPDRLHIGQVLKLPFKRRVEPKTGHEILLSYWRKHLEAPESSTRASRPHPAEPLAQDPRVREAFLQAIRERSPQRATSSADSAQAVTEEQLLKTEEEEEAEREAVTAERLFQEGQEALAQNDYALALERFKTCREKDPRLVKAWISEIVALGRMNKRSEAQLLAQELAEAYPRFKILPAVRNALEQRSVP